MKENNFAKRLNQLRNEMGLSQNRLAGMIGVSGQAVSKWENEHSMPDIDTIPLIANVLSTSIDYLLIGDTSKKHKELVLDKSVLAGFDISDEYVNLLLVLNQKLPRTKLYELATFIEDKKIEVSMDLRMKVEGSDNDFDISKTIDLNKVKPEMLMGVADQLVTMSNRLFQKHKGIPDDVLEIMCCPTCGSAIDQLETDSEKVVCEKGHRFNIINGVVDFGYREQDGNCWSFGYKTYERYYKAHINYDPMVRRPESKSCYEMLISHFKQVKPQVFIDAGTGEGMGIGMLLKEIDWPCTAILTDLSHRILRYNKQFIEEVRANPYVTIVYMACDLRALPIKDHSVDCVWSYSGYGNMEPDKIEQGLQEAHRVLKEGGALIYDAYKFEVEENSRVKMWLESMYQAHPETKVQGYEDYIKSNTEWDQVYNELGFRKWEQKQVSPMLVLPEDGIFPWENQILQWVSTNVALCYK